MNVYGDGCPQAPDAGAETSPVVTEIMEHGMAHMVATLNSGLAGGFVAAVPSAWAGLNKCLLFHDLSPTDMAVVGRAANRRHVAKGAIIFEQDDRAHRLFVLIEGRVKAVQTTADGQQVTARFLAAGEPFGCVAMMHAERYPVGAVAETECEIASWDAPVVVQLAHRYPQIAINALAYVGAQLRETQLRLREAVTERAERRIAHTLLRLIRQAGRRTDEGIEIGFPVSRQDVAEMTGSRLFTVSRTLSKWESLGIIKSGRRRIIVRAPHRLLDVAEEG